jgi:hypothetical protein
MISLKESTFVKKKQLNIEVYKKIHMYTFQLNL